MQAELNNNPLLLLLVSTMKMSILVNAIAAAATAAGSATLTSASLMASSSASMTSSASSLRRATISRGRIGIADTARRRASSALCGGGCSTIDNSRVRHHGSTNSIHSARGYWNGQGNFAFASLQLQPSHKLSSSLSFTQRYFTNNNNNHNNNKNDEMLPWSPIIETSTSHHPPHSSTSTALQMTPPNFGTEGFRDAIRGGQEYIKFRGPAATDVDDEDESKQKSQQSHQQQQKQTKGGPIPFPKMTPGRQRNYRPPHVVLQQQSFGGGGGGGGSSQQHSNSAAAQSITTAEKDYCDALNPAEKENCLESFREGRQYRQETTTTGSSSRTTSSSSSGTNPNAMLTTAEKDYCDALNPADREHCLENFRDGRENAGYLNVKGPAVEAANVLERMERRDEEPLPQSVSTVNGDSNDGDVEYVEREVIETGSRSEHFRDGPRGAARSGSDVEYLDDSLDENVGSALPAEDDNLRINPIKGDNKGSSFYDKLGPSSMHFRDGKHMSVFKDSAFRVASSVPSSKSELDKRDEERAYEELLGGGEPFNEDESDDEAAEGLAEIDALLRDSIEHTIEDIKAAQQSIMGDGDAISSKKADVSITAPVAEFSKASPSSTLLSIDPKSIDIIPLDKGRALEEGDEADVVGAKLEKSTLEPIPHQGMPRPTSTTLFSGWESSGSFVKMFRGSASYIANHRGTLAVYHIPGELLAWEGFPGLMDDIALTWLLGMKIVLVAGCRHQIDLRLEEDEEEYGDDEEGGHLGGRVMMSSIRVTDEETLRVVKEEAGFVRFEIERRLAKSLRLHGGLVKGSESLVGNVVSGNFYSAQPFGVVDGIDYCWTGFPRKVEIDRIRQVHETHDIVLLTSLGVSPSGEIFNVNSEFLAATVAGAMSASKIIYFNVHGTSFKNKVTEKPVQNLRVSDAKNLLAHYKMRIHPKGFALVDLDSDSPQQSVLRTPGSMETLIKVGYSMVALEKGVKRAHILAPENGALVQELYTRDGCGTLISRDIYEGIRRADVNDVSGIYDLIEPLVRAGTLVERPKSTLEKEILSYYVYTRDGLIVATGQLKRFEGGFAEIGCLVVSRDYRRGGRGDAMLGYLERLSLQCGARKVFVLSTQTMEWFVERGFREVPVESLPPSRQAVYNKKRKSKIYMKEIDSDRDLDAAELWWSNK